MKRADIIRCLRQCQPMLEAMGVRHAYLFGSVARDAAKEASDIDLMVDLDEGPGGRKPLFSAFDVGGIQHELTKILGRRVDLVVRRDVLKTGSRLQSAASSLLVDVF